MIEENRSPWIIAGQSKPENLTRKQIIETVCEVLLIDVRYVLKKSRKRELVLPRQIYCLLARKYTSLTWAQIGDYIGSRDHSTACTAVKTIQGNMEHDRRLNELVQKCELELNVTIDKLVIE